MANAWQQHEKTFSLSLDVWVKIFINQKSSESLNLFKAKRQPNDVTVEQSLDMFHKNRTEISEWFVRSNAWHWVRRAGFLRRRPCENENQSRTDQSKGWLAVRSASCVWRFGTLFSLLELSSVESIRSRGTSGHSQAIDRGRVTPINQPFAIIIAPWIGLGEKRKKKENVSVETTTEPRKAHKLIDDRLKGKRNHKRKKRRRKKNFC